MDNKERISKLENLAKLCRLVCYLNIGGAVLNAYTANPNWIASFGMALALWFVGGLCTKQAGRLKDEQ